MKNNTMIAIFTLLIGLLMLSACTGTQGVTSSASQNNVTAPRTVTVTGNGTVYLVPDIAYVNIGVQTNSESVMDAVNQNNDQAQAIRNALNGLGITDADIQTSGFNVYPSPVYSPDGTITGNMYYASNTVTVTVRELSALGSLLNTVVETGANTINGITFDVQDRSAAVSQALQLAITDAHSQASDITSAVNVQLGEVQTVSTSFAQAVNPYSYGIGGGGTAAMSPSAVPVASGQLSVTVSAMVVYAIH